MQRRAFLRTGGVAGAAVALPQSVVASTASGASTALESSPDGEPLGRVEVDGAAEAVVGDDGETAYLAATTGFVTVDISDPADPAILAERLALEVDGTRMTEILDVSVDGDRLAVVGPANSTSADVFHGFVIYDVSDPADPVVVSHYETGFHIHNCVLEDDLLYVVENTPDAHSLVIFDVGDEPTEIGRWSLLEYEPEWADVYWLARYLHDVTVADDIAVLAHWNAGTYLLDVSDPTDPTMRSRVRETDLETQLERGNEDAQMGLPGNDHYSAIDDSGDLLAVGREAWDTGGDAPDGPGGIDLYDASDPTALEFRATIDAPAADDASYYGGQWTTAHNFELRDDRLYSSWYQGGVKVHDVSDPAAPKERMHWHDADTAGFWTARVADPGDTFIASSTPLIPNTDTVGALYTFRTDPSETASNADSTDSIPGFTGLAGAVGLAGGAMTLEWLRRRRGVDER
ncbi:LVIVD repeat-containing protein [Natronorubrum sulfidifaciens]|uniref:LVIVD repeat protein n=1 Tax=Natronorubrum sulfidifaciens JCM 14089 TaxID=1230460 RepID=L9WDW8_9EURY|nr:LVIVD repeat protein [Natronorubrum sulfidifaciens]ELY47527.1 LVIVD repeat protein [Natronorubrum sulfidifaciens JCM 14089]